AARSPAEKREYIHCCRPAGLSIAEGCRLMGLRRSTFYAEPQVQPIDEARLVADQGGGRRVARLRLSSRDRPAAWRRPYREPQEGHAADEGKRPDRAAAAAVHCNDRQ